MSEILLDRGIELLSRDRSKRIKNPDDFVYVIYRWFQMSLSEVCTYEASEEEAEEGERHGLGGHRGQEDERVEAEDVQHGELEDVAPHDLPSAGRGTMQ